MTAPIVWRSDRSPLSAWQLSKIGPHLGDASRVPRSERPAGQLWERLAERAEAHS